MFYAGFCDLGHFYSAKPPPWSLDLGFHTLDGDFVVLFVNAHLETLKKWKTNLPKGLFCRRRITSFGSNGGRRPRLPHPLLELLKPPPKAVYLCIQFTSSSFSTLLAAFWLFAWFLCKPTLRILTLTRRQDLDEGDEFCFALSIIASVVLSLAHWFYMFMLIKLLVSLSVVWLLSLSLALFYYLSAFCPLMLACRTVILVNINVSFSSSHRSFHLLSIPLLLVCLCTQHRLTSCQVSIPESHQGWCQFRLSYDFNSCPNSKLASMNPLLALPHVHGRWRMSAARVCWDGGLVWRFDGVIQLHSRKWMYCMN